MIVGPAAERPAVLAVSLGDRMFVDAGDAPLHQAVGIELPVLVAVGAEPEAVVVVVLVGDAHGDAVAGGGPQFLDQAVVELARPFAAQEGLDLGAAVDELGAVAPLAVGRVGQRHPHRVARVPASSAMRTFCAAVSGVKGGSGGRAPVSVMQKLPLS